MEVTMRQKIMQRAINVWAAIALAGVVVVIVASGVLWHGEPMDHGDSSHEHFTLR